MAVISDGKVQVTLLSTGACEALVTWTTDQAADSSVTWGVGAGIDGTVRDSAAVTAHSLSLTGLAAATDYYALPASTTERGDPCSYDGATMPADGRIAFTTPTVAAGGGGEDGDDDDHGHGRGHDEHGHGRGRGHDDRGHGRDDGRGRGGRGHG